LICVDTPTCPTVGQRRETLDGFRLAHIAGMLLAIQWTYADSVRAF